MFETVLTKALDPQVAITPDQFADLMQMFLALMYLRKVEPVFWFQYVADAVRGIALAQTVNSESALYQIPDLPEPVKKVIETAINLSLQEVEALRGKLMAAVRALREMPSPGTALN